jgi:hypothetical protein
MTKTKSDPIARQYPWLFGRHVYEGAAAVRVPDGERSDEHVVIAHPGYPVHELHYKKRISGWSIALDVWAETHTGDAVTRVPLMVNGDWDDSVVAFWNSAVDVLRRASSDKSDAERVAVIKQLKAYADAAAR